MFCSIHLIAISQEVLMKSNTFGDDIFRNTTTSPKGQYVDLKCDFPSLPEWALVFLPIFNLVSITVVGADDDEHVLEVWPDWTRGERQSARLLEHNCYDVISYVALS